MTKKLRWRLSKLPDSHEVITLIANKVITREEAREILFSNETEDDRDKESLKSEIKFLRELVEKLSQSNSKVVEIIREVERPWRSYPWYTPYQIWCSNVAGTNAAYSSGITNLTVSNADSSNTFTGITTF